MTILTPAELDAIEARAKTAPLEIVFDGPPSHESGRFVEAERGGKSVNCGEWVKRTDGLWSLVIADTDIPALIATIRALREGLGLILPLAQGYAAAHAVGSNQEIVNQARELLGEKP